MANPTYTINKGINKPVEFKGLKAQYIWHLGGSVVGVLVLFAVMYIVGISSYICLPVSLGLGGVLISRVYRMSRKYGQHGLMKLSARKSVPKSLSSKSRKVFTQLKKMP
ncbi:MAG TPA: DUF4133 domain-containing protein [Puia sp.]|nr:DUF4133 domain-containing protein [Puia sp.]